MRPAAIHRCVRIVRAGRYQPVSAIREKLDDDRAANRAVAQVVHTGLFKVEWGMQFACRRVMDSLGNLRTFVDEFHMLGADLPPHDWLVQRVRRALDATPGKKKIVVRGPLILRALIKLDGKD